MNAMNEGKAVEHNRSVYMDILIEGWKNSEKQGKNTKCRIEIELFCSIAPRTCENFRALCAGDRGLGKFTNRPVSAAFSKNIQYAIFYHLFPS